MNGDSASGNFKRGTKACLWYQWHNSKITIVTFVEIRKCIKDQDCNLFPYSNELFLIKFMQYYFLNQSMNWDSSGVLDNPDQRKVFEKF
jgi:hypothetical protein